MLIPIVFLAVLADHIVVDKSDRTLTLVQHGQIIKTYKVTFGRQPTGRKEREGDDRTPEGQYVIDHKGHAPMTNRIPILLRLHQILPPNIDALMFRMIAKSHRHHMQFSMLTDRCQSAVVLALQIRDFFGGKFAHRPLLCSLTKHARWCRRDVQGTSLAPLSVRYAQEREGAHVRADAYPAN